MARCFPLTVCLLMMIITLVFTQDYQEMAAVSINTFLEKFLTNDTTYLWDTYPSNGQLTAYWTFAQGFDTIIDAAQRVQKNPHSLDHSFEYYKDLIQRLYVSQDGIGWDRPYIDDMNWMALALLRAYHLTGEKMYLEKCLYLYSKIESNWDVTCCGDVRGGIWWDTAHTQKATASNAGPVILASRLYDLTKDVTYLNFAKKVWVYWYETMVSFKNYSVCDHIESPSGNKQCSWSFTYNEGLMVGASISLYTVTKLELFKSAANKIANYSQVEQIIHAKYGNVLFDGYSCNGDCDEFKGIAFRYLMELEQITKEFYLKLLLKSCVLSMWNLARNSESLFAVNWIGPSPKSSDTIQQAQMNAATMALNLYAYYN
jgi:predicted alpha-1,6-mannanase (GH76 family)